MKHLYFVVEGETELEFVNRLLIPYLIKKGLNTHIQGLMVTMSGGGHGYNNVAHFENTIKPILNYQDEPYITTLMDYFGLNSERKMPGYTECMKLAQTDDKIACLEKSLQEQVQKLKSYRFFIPYIQKHEVETFLFADPENGFDLEEEAIKKGVLAVCAQYPAIEEINTTTQGAPSKRLDAIYKENGLKYQKGADAVDIAELTGIEMILERCPRFKNWIEDLIKVIVAS